MDDLETTNNEINDSDHIAKEKLNQRREARRRKILNNAKNRLERLNGRTDNDEKPKTQYEHTNGPNLIASTESAEFSDPEVEPDIMRTFRERGQFPDTNFEPNTMMQQQNQGWDVPANGFNEIFNMFQAPPAKERHVLIKARFHLIILALISALLAIFWRENGFSIFIPAGLCLITDLLFFREQKPLHPILNMLFMMFSNRLPPQAKNFLHILAIVQSIIVDLGIFLFSFCTMFYLILVCTNSYFTGLMVIK